MLGDKIRKKRSEKNLSLKELAEKISLTASFLSQIERDLAEPSISSLRKIANALEVPIFFFLIDDQKSSPVVRRSERKTLKLPKSHLIYELLTPDVNRAMELFIARIEPNTNVGEEGSTHPGEECNLVMQGTMEIRIGEETYTLEEGDSIYYFASLPHSIRNAGDEEMVFLSAITPPRF